THGGETLTVSLGQGPEEALANRALHFKAASFDEVLDIYQSLIRRTVISRVRFGREITLKSAAGLSAQKAGALLSRAFLEKRIAVKLSGENFALLVDADHVDQLAGLSEPPPPISRLRLLQGDILSKVGLGKFAPEVFPPGMMKFQDTDILQVLD